MAINTGAEGLTIRNDPEPEEEEIVPRTNLNPVVVPATGVAAAPVAADMTNGNMFTAGGDVFLRLSNTNAAARTVTIQTPKTISGLTVQDPVINVPANTGVVYVGPFPASLYAQPSGVDQGKVYMDASGVGVSYEVLRLPRSGSV